MASFEDYGLPGGFASSYYVDGLADAMAECSIIDNDKVEVAEAMESSSNEEFLNDWQNNAGPASICADDEDASLDVYRLGFVGFNRQRRSRRVLAVESERVDIDHLVAGPPMLNFNEPLPDIPEEDEMRAPIPIINGGDVGPDPVDRQRSLVHAVISSSSLEDLQSVVSQLDLETSLQSKSSCHSPHHINIHGSHQGTCCRNAVHNITLESLDLDMNHHGIGIHGHLQHCCSHPQNRFKRSMSMSKRSCMLLP